MNILGARYSEKIAGLVYLDAAFNRADGSEEYDSVARTLPRAPNPQASDLASVSALQAFQKKVWGDESSSRAPPVVRQAITKVMQQTTTAYNPDPIPASPQWRSMLYRNRFLTSCVLGITPTIPRLRTM